MMNNVTMQHNSYPMRIKQLLLIVTRDRYQDVYHRVYNINATDTNTIGKLATMADPHQPSHKVDDVALAMNLPNIININPRPLHQVQIANGWRTQRLRFLLEVEYEGATSQTTFIQGFSEYYDPTYRGSIDGNMSFYINSVTSVSKILNPLTGQFNIQPLETYNVLTDRSGADAYDSFSSKMNTLRPKDIINNIYMDDRYSVEGFQKIINTTDKVSADKVHTSDRSNNNMYNYLSRSIDAYTNAKLQSDLSYNVYDILKNASNACYEMEYTNNVFIRSLCELTGDFNPTKFTLNQLETIFPGFKNSNKITLVERGEFQSVSHLNMALDSDDTHETLNPTYENSKALLLANIIPSIALDCLLTRVEFSITNTSGQLVILPTYFNSFISSSDLTYQINKFKAKIATLVGPQLTDNNQCIVDAFVACDVIGDINIGIGINNQPLLVYRFPVFADSLYTPMLGDKQASNMLQNDIGGIFDELIPGNVGTGLVNQFGSPYI